MHLCALASGVPLKEFYVPFPPGGSFPESKISAREAERSWILVPTCPSDEFLFTISYPAICKVPDASAPAKDKEVKCKHEPHAQKWQIWAAALIPKAIIHKALFYNWP